MKPYLKKAPVVSLATASGARRFVYAKLFDQLEFDIDNDKLTAGLPLEEKHRVWKAARGVLKHLLKRSLVRKP